MDRFVGKFVGFVLGFAIGGWLGAAIGFLLGHLHDWEGQPREPGQGRRGEGYFPDFDIDRNKATAFSVSVIVLGAKLAKVDGPVTPTEILAFRESFRTEPYQLKEVGRLFDMARSSSEGYEAHAMRLSHLFMGEPAILEQILEGLFRVAKADTAYLARSEMIFLRRVAVIFGISEEEFSHIASQAGVYITNAAQQAPRRERPFDVLGLPNTASDDVIKRTYRALIRKHHPDKLQAAGLPPATVAEATEKMKRINAAYAEICKARNIK